MAATAIHTAHPIPRPLPISVERWREKAGEYFWLSVCLVLFMVLGPFAAPIALGFVLSNHASGTAMVEPDRIDE